MNKNILPIGSVVKLKNLEKPVLIFGFLQKCGVEHIKIVDYVGVPYPEGNVGAFAQIGFQNADIEDVLFEGYITEEFDSWSQLVQQYREKIDN